MKHPLTPLAKKLRATPTPAERRLWYFLRKRPLGYKFRRQVPIDAYIVDFACFEARLVVEVDGQFHANQPADLDRDEAIRAQGWLVARYWNDDVKRNIEGVLLDVERRLAACADSPTPAYRHPRPLGGGSEIQGGTLGC